MRQRPTACRRSGIRRTAGSISRPVLDRCRRPSRCSVGTASSGFSCGAGDWLNPILVKETRQALKSLQFTITFVLVLVACWVVTIGGVAFIGPRFFTAAAGGTMLCVVLRRSWRFRWSWSCRIRRFARWRPSAKTTPTILLSITTLKPRQIISGKLGSSIVQMAVYFSAITPCLAFTYLLRGVDVPTIAVLLVYTFLGRLGCRWWAFCWRR